MVSTYVDDVIVMGRSFQEHLRYLRQVFERLREAGLTLKPTNWVSFRLSSTVLWKKRPDLSRKQSAMRHFKHWVRGFA